VHCHASEQPSLLLLLPHHLRCHLLLLLPLQQATHRCQASL
jgi:hypothetical protein